MEHSNQVGSYTQAHQGLMHLLSDSVMARLSRPSEPQAATDMDEQPVSPAPDTFFLRRRSKKRCGCDQCKAVRAAM